MNTSEVLDLSKENVQPLKQGRNAVKLGTALQAQVNAELHQKLLAEREQYELLIRMYEGDDPLKPHYDYVHWIEQSFPKHGPESNLVQILENTLTTFKDDERYKHDGRYAELLIKYIETQPNPLEIYQLVYNQGLCTMCAAFYKAWAEELDKLNDLKTADQIYELGIRVKAQPLEVLQEAHLRFQLSVGRRMLGHQEETNEIETDYNRQALHKLQKQNIHSIRNPTGAPGRIKQQPLANNKNQNNLPFKVYQGDDKEHSNFSEGYGKVFPKQTIINEENILKAGPWSQTGGKHRSRQAPLTPTPFQVHEDEGANLRNGHHRVSSVPRALKPRKIDNFTCPLAVFEPPDPTKKPMYCKNKVYAGGREFQFEELRAALYNRRYEKLAALNIQQDVETEVSLKVNVKDEQVTPVTNTDPISDSNQEVNFMPSTDLEINQDHKQPPFEIENEKMIFDGKAANLEANTSFSHCQSFTVNTKEAMNVVQEMWNSPSPASGFRKDARASRAYLSPVGLDASGVFKVPAVPPLLCRSDETFTPDSLPKSPVKKTPGFTIYTDGEPAPEPEQSEVKTDSDIDSKNTHNPRKGENVTVPAQLFTSASHLLPTSQRRDEVYLPGSDAATLKMLAFQSDSDDDSGNDMPKTMKIPTEHVVVNAPLLSQHIPTVSVTAPTPAADSIRKSFGAGLLSQPEFHDEDKFEDMTCNTKAFDFVLPSSTPLIGHLKTTTGQSIKNCINGSFINEEVKKNATKQDLSMIFEASKERYSSSSGSNGSKTQGSVCTVANTSVPAAHLEVIEKLAQISSNKSFDEVEKSLGLLNISGPLDPFSTELIARLLSHIGYPKKHHLIGLYKLDADTPPLHVNSTTKLGDTKYSVTGELGKGNYARVLKAMRDGQPVALKQQRPAWEWEWYIVQELQSRLPPIMMGGYLHMCNGYIYKNASILESEWAQYGSILSVVNKLKTAGKGHDLNLALLLSIQLIKIVEYLHKCQIIHGDIKPDNFVLCSLPSLSSTDPCLKLIDFGRSIDMTLFPEGTTFTTVVTTDGFQCNEMKEHLPWTYQTDLYGLAGSIYCVLFYDYMKVTKKDKKWQLTNKIPRYMMPAMWQEIFTPLLNVESCEKLPDLTVLRETLEQHLKTMDSATINQSIMKLSNVLLNK